ncbi:MAG: PepSY-like domain-containing protein [Verrucomicrobiota bacterium]|jgi:hypothetical protein
MRRTFHRLLIGASILLATSALAGAGRRANANAALLQTLPIPVRRTVQAEIATGTLDSVSRTNGDDGEVIYDVDFTRLGKSRNMTVALDGKLLDIQVFLDETPFPVRTAIQTLSQGGQLGDITKNIGDYDDFTYEVELTRDGATRTFTVDDNGVLLEMQVPLKETPPSVQHAINAKVGADILGDITKTIDGDQVNYAVEMTKADRRRSFTVSAKGELVQEQVFADELPQPVQKAVQTQARRGHLGKINQSTEQGKVSYEVTVNIGPNTCRVTLDAAGALDSEEQDLVWASLPAKVKIALHPLQVAGEQVNDVTRTTKGTNTTYDIQLRLGPARRTLTFDSDGNIVPP